MNNDKSGDEQAAREKFEAWLREIEAAAAELVELGEALFSRGELRIRLCCSGISSTNA